jgi:cytochrome P450
MSRPHAASPPSKGQAGADSYAIPLDRIDVSDSELFETDTHWGYFERLRKEAPVHYCAESDFGPFWSVTRYHDVVHVEKAPEIFSSAKSIVVGDPDPRFPLEAGFITMDGPKHDAHRKVVQPVAAPRNLVVLEPLIRARVREILDSLPVCETFDWVDTSRSSSPPVCSRRSSTSHTASAASSPSGRTWRRPAPRRSAPPTRPRRSAAPR